MSYKDSFFWIRQEREVLVNITHSCWTPLCGRVTHSSRQRGAYALITGVAQNSAREPLHSVSPANWGPLNNTGQKLLSQWVVIDFTSRIEARFPLLSNEPAAPSLPTTPLIARWRYSPSVPSERSAFSVRPPPHPPPRTVTYSSRHFLSSLPSLQAHFPFCVVSCSKVLCSVVLLILRLITWNRGILLRKGRHPLDMTVPFWRACLHLCVQLCRCHSAVYGSHRAAPPMPLFVLVD